ncbi:MAG: RNA methyltransferase [Chloroherpetonaceae bacterium]|nr:RNA methyltransferase [Chloroherpetonaceae bacterium]MDW8436911.1 RNA methyltransferase [Chloroherpetonaceae bacterium]
MAKRLTNAQQKFYARLRREKKVRDKERLFLAEGLRVARELFSASPNSLVALIQREGFSAPDIAPERTFLASEKQFASLCDVENPQGVIGVFEQPTLSPTALFSNFSQKQSAIAFALDDLQDPGNLGSIIRSAAWFELDALIASAGTADFFNPKVVRSTAGSLFALALYRSDNLVADLRRLKEMGFAIYGATTDGEDYLKTRFAAKSVVVIGNEANGISDGVLATLDAKVRIGGNPRRVESLNAAVSAGILMAKIKERNA